MQLLWASIYKKGEGLSIGNVYFWKASNSLSRIWFEAWAGSEAFKQMLPLLIELKDFLLAEVFDSSPISALDLLQNHISQKLPKPMRNASSNKQKDPISNTKLLDGIKNDSRISHSAKRVAELWLTTSLSGKLIAERLRMASPTVRNHLTDIYKYFPEARRKK